MGGDDQKRNKRKFAFTAKFALATLGILASFTAFAFIVRRLVTGGGRMRRINSYVLNGTKALDLSKLARKHIPVGGRYGAVERAALLAAEVEYNIRVDTSLQSRQVLNKPKRRLLCSTFTTATSDSLDLLHANMRQLGELCDWAVVFYKTPPSAAVHKFRLNLTDSLPAVRVVLLEAASERVDLVRKFYMHQLPDKFNTAAYPKPLLFLHLLPLLDSYHRVWLLDDDIGLAGFKLDPFLAICDCAFWPQRPPLIVQPLLHPISKLYPFLSDKEWREEERRSGTTLLAASSAFVEVQAPILDASFLSWFLRFLVVPMVAPLHIMGADWGFDDLFCTAAANFNHYSGRRGPSASDAAPACAVIVGGSTIRHLDRGVLKAAIGKGTKWYLHHEMLALVVETFPTLFHKGFLSLLASPVNATGRVLHQRVAGPLDQSCLTERLQQVGPSMV